MSITSKDLQLLQTAYNDIIVESKCCSSCDQKKQKAHACKKSNKLNLQKKEDEFKESISPLFDSVFNQFVFEAFGKEPYSNTYEHDKRVWLLRRLSNGEISEISNNDRYKVEWKTPKDSEKDIIDGKSVLKQLNNIKSIQREDSDLP